ncbi:MAG: helix-turn-helix domain-containing protein [Anaerolineales bacterium]|jgi:transcriptional regulator with XRE-family HTH domain
MAQEAVAFFYPEGLGEKLREQRLASELELNQTADFIQLEPQAYAKYETGEAFPTLVELETLAYYFDCLPEYFWESIDVDTPAESQKPEINYGLIARIRRRSIGLTIRKFRIDAGLTLDQLAEALGISAPELENIELGEVNIPVNQLFAAADATGHTPREFLDRKSPVGAWAESYRIKIQLEDLPDELKEFAAKPINRPYLELAKRLSEMPVKQLREIAEGLLEITL